MKEIRTEIIINASANQVWNVLTDFSSYKNWNPFLISIKGELKVGSTLINRLKINEKIQTFKPTVIEIIPGKSFKWRGKLPLGMFNGEHAFEIETIHEQQVKLIHSEIFTGWLSGVILKQVEEGTRNGFIAMNKAVKLEVENK